MSGKEKLSLDEFATAPRKQPVRTVEAPTTSVTERPVENADMTAPPADRLPARGSTGDASKALRQMKRARMKGASHFVNVNLDRETKRRLKLAAFNTDTSMQALMEKAIRQFLDANGF